MEKQIQSDRQIFHIIHVRRYIPVKTHSDNSKWKTLIQIPTDIFYTLKKQCTSSENMYLLLSFRYRFSQSHLIISILT